MDPSLGTLQVWVGATRTIVPFSRLRRLTLKSPLRLWESSQVGGSPARLSPGPEQEYRFKSTAPGFDHLTGRTVGYVHAREGFYLFSPTERPLAFERVFIPSQAFSDHQFGPFADDIGLREISDPQELLEALANQRGMRVRPIGQSLLALRLVTQARLDQALADQTDAHPLGEMLVRSGHISRSDLENALAHKMGCPIVDLIRFPIDPAATKAMPLRIAVSMRAVPVMMTSEGLVVAVSKLARVDKLRRQPALAELRIIPVLAPRARILEALTQMSEHQAWDGVPLSLGYFATTT